MLNRGLEGHRSYFRCGRYFTVGSDWYATVREGKEIGPYETRDAAEIALAKHVTECFEKSKGHIGQIDAHCQRDATILEVLVQELASCREQVRLRGDNAAYIWAKRRIQAMGNNPKSYDHVATRANAIKHFLLELDR